MWHNYYKWCMKSTAAWSLSIASFPGLPTIQFLIACSTAVLQAIKNWTVGRPGIEATLSNGYIVGIFWWWSLTWGSCNFLDVPLVAIASFPGLPTVQFLIAGYMIASNSIGHMIGIYVLGYSGDVQLELTIFAGFKSHLRSEVWQSYNFLDVPLV